MISIAHIIAQDPVGMKQLRAALRRPVAVLAAVLAAISGLAASTTAAAQTNSQNGANS